MAIEHPWMSVARGLDAIKDAIANGEPLPATAEAVVELAAVVVRRHGELVQRIKAAIGPNLCRAARIEAEAAAEPESVECCVCRRQLMAGHIVRCVRCHKPVCFVCRRAGVCDLCHEVDGPGEVSGPGVTPPRNPTQEEIEVAFSAD